MPFLKMSDNDLKSFLHAEKPTFHKIISIKIMSKETKETIISFCQIILDISQNNLVTTNLGISGYTLEHAPTESSARGVP